MTVFFPTSLEKFHALAAGRTDAVVMAGGTDLMVRLRSTARKPENIICLENIAELHTVECTETQLCIGAAVPLTRLLHSPELDNFSVLRQALSSIGSPLIRNMATLGGNICTASPAGDSLPALYVLDAEVELVSEGDSRKMPIASFIRGPGKIDLRPGEILASILIPAPEPDSIHHFEKVGQRRALAISLAGMAALVQLDGENITRIRLAWGSVGPTIVRCPEAEQALEGGKMHLERLQRAAEIVRQTVSPISDIRATADYRRQVAGNLLLRLAAMTSNC